MAATASVEVFNALNAFHGREADPVLYSLSTDGLSTNGFFGERYSPADTRTLQFGLSIGF